MPFLKNKSKTELTLENRKLRNILAILRSENELKLKKKDRTIKTLRQEIKRLNKKFILYFNHNDTDSDTDYETPSTGTEIDIHCSDTDSDADTHRRKNIFN